MQPIISKLLLVVSAWLLLPAIVAVIAFNVKKISVVKRVLVIIVLILATAVWGAAFFPVAQDTLWLAGKKFNTKSLPLKVGKVASVAEGMQTGLVRAVQFEYPAQEKYREYFSAQPSFAKGEIGAIRFLPQSKIILDARRAGY